MSHAPAPDLRRRQTVVVLLVIVVPLLLLGAVWAYVASRGADPAAPPVSATGSTGPMAPPVEAPQASTSTPEVAKDDHAAGDSDVTMTAADRAKVIDLAVAYTDAWSKVRGEGPRRKALSGLATPANIDLMAYTRPGAATGRRAGKPTVVDGDTYSGTVRVPMKAATGDNYLIVLREPNARYGWTVAYVYPADDYEKIVGGAAPTVNG